ncbi:hypothetical protein [Candidatus Uabimicrobium sp. HlEnr_7]|uniref:hypothetical protein n=1 Tax=Candidatus Uabimicrobium helgolandensis TaxID=3095367 RepID=UPI0035563F4A
MAKKNPVTAIQQAIEEEEKEQQPQKIRLYTMIIGVCCILNLLVLPISNSSHSNYQILNDTEIPINIEEDLELLSEKILDVENSVETFSSSITKPFAVKPIFEKKMGKSIELIIQRLIDMDSSLNTITKNIKKIRKEVVSLEQKQIDIKEKLRNK